MSEAPTANTPEGADGDDEVQQTALKSGEDRRAAAAMASMDAHDDEDGGDGGGGSGGSRRPQVDSEAASKAMKSLSSTVAVRRAAEVKKVKVDAADVALLVNELETSKTKATELLKAHDGDALRALKAFVSASA